jgi:hypothetical protein
MLGVEMAQPPIDVQLGEGFADAFNDSSDVLFFGRGCSEIVVNADL